MKPIGLFRRGGRVPKSSFFEKPNKTMSFFRSALQSTLLKHASEVFFVLGNADFFKFKNASELSWRIVLLIRVLYREKIMRHVQSVNLTYCSEMSGLWNFSVRVQSWTDKIESDPVLIRKIFENRQSDPVLIRPCKIMCFYFASWTKTTMWAILPSAWLIEGKIVPEVLLHHETK